MGLHSPISQGFWTERKNLFMAAFCGDKFWDNA